MWVAIDFCANREYVLKGVSDIAQSKVLKKLRGQGGPELTGHFTLTARVFTRQRKMKRITSGGWYGSNS
jgi:hypothetical protein